MCGERQFRICAASGTDDADTGETLRMFVNHGSHGEADVFQNPMPRFFFPDDNAAFFCTYGRCGERGTDGLSECQQHAIVFSRSFVSTCGQRSRLTAIYGITDLLHTCFNLRESCRQFRGGDLCQIRQSVAQSRAFSEDLIFSVCHQFNIAAFLPAESLADLQPQPLRIDHMLQPAIMHLNSVDIHVRSQHDGVGKNASVASGNGFIVRGRDLQRLEISGW